MHGVPDEVTIRLHALFTDLGWIKPAPRSSESVPQVAQGSAVKRETAHCDLQKLSGVDMSDETTEKRDDRNSGPIVTANV